MINTRSVQLVADVSNVIVQWRMGIPPRQIARWTRTRMETSGPMMTKLGQMVACRPDVLPPEVTNEFKPLLKSVKPVPYDAIVDLVPAKVEIDTVPIATASIAQVHIGRYKGQQVAVKIKKPNLDKNVFRDIQTIRSIVNAGMGLFPPLRDVDAFLDEFEVLMKQEVNFVQEAAKMRKYNDNSNPIIVTPIVYDEVSNENVIVMEYIPSQALDVFKSSSSVWQRRNACNTLMHAYIHRLLTKGTFHADLHEGNLGFLDDGRIVLYDFGSISSFSASSHAFLRHASLHIMTGNVDGLVDEMIERKIILPINKDRFDQADVQIIKTYVGAIQKYVFDTDIKNVAESIKLVAGSQTRAPFIFSESFVLMLRSISMLEGVCKELDPDFSYASSLVGVMLTDAGTHILQAKMNRDLQSMFTRFLNV